MLKFVEQNAFVIEYYLSFVTNKVFPFNLHGYCVVTVEKNLVKKETLFLWPFPGSVLLCSQHHIFAYSQIWHSWKCTP